MRCLWPIYCAQSPHIFERKINRCKFHKYWKGAYKIVRPAILWSPTRLAAVSCQELSPVSNQLVVVKLYCDPTLPRYDILNKRCCGLERWSGLSHSLERV